MLFTTLLAKLTKKIICSLIQLYQGTAIIRSPACRFEPSCSEYSRQAIELHGIIKGSSLSLKRLLRCHPWGKSGYDPVN
jgi:putative membrane protein insertion efficiency factor